MIMLGVSSVFAIVRASGDRATQIAPLMMVEGAQPKTQAPSLDPVTRSIAAPAELETDQPTTEVVSETPVENGEIRYFNGRAIQPVRVLRMKVTAYSPDERSCGRFADGKTAAGYSVFTNGGKLVAADTRILPFGSLLTVPGYDDQVVPVLDRGGLIKGYTLDVLYPTHRQARKWGVRYLDVTVWGYVD